ncbi:calcium/sodium antiporter [Halomonas sp. McH1-25]|nr:MULTISPECIES: calcium/sodium antiporter [unclassified Halomonas]MCG7598591.1 calcium/sodium antiporter [Halomonas sp. McH1-25]MCP1342287.1 calcium/sodium antiporter [Halomonas sp. FL8]MCP1360622.1 calcium/sodium antiporter [Halomonas sp. BBD45]MCP1365234.1 calcium/sodium antiporter [Halomonas sp. BBD48]
MAIAAIVVGLIILVWSADRFVDGAAATAKHLGVPSLLIGMLVIGFGTSAPELMVSALAAGQGNPGLALGNAYGSNITNIGLILGFVALMSPLAVHSQVLKQELPLLGLVTLISAWFLLDGTISRLDATILIVLLFVVMGISIWRARQGNGDALGVNTEQDMAENAMSLKAGVVWTLVGLVLLIASSRMLVWGAVYIAQTFGVSDLIIGLTVVAVGTSLPELASSISAVRKKEHDLVLGNVVGSNLFNTLGVVGLAGVIAPIHSVSEALSRDWPVMAALTLAVVIFGIGWRGQGRINRLEAAALLAAYVGYTGYLVYTVISA